MLGLFLIAQTMVAQTTTNEQLQAAPAVQVVGGMFFEDLPPQPTEFGKCYAKCRVPDCVVELSKTIKIKDEEVRKKVIPAVYETVTEKVLLKEASSRLKVIPAQYETVTERILVKEASTQIYEVPPQYTTVTEKVLVSPAFGKWVKKRTSPNCLSTNPEDCYTMCWEEIPAKYETITKKMVVPSGESKVVEVPAEYKTVTKRVLKSPARTEEVVIPAEYNTITKRVLVSPARVETVVIPAEWETVYYPHVADTGGFTEWREILCDGKTNVGVIQQVQQALAAKGYYLGQIDGLMGSRTELALQRYQEDQKLPTGGLTIETLQSLGINN